MVLPISGGEATNPKTMEDLYASVRYWGTEEEDDIHFPDWKGVDDYRDSVDPKSLSANFAAQTYLIHRLKCTLATKIMM